MRDYSKISSSFWTGKTGRSLRGDMETQLVALYLMNNSHDNMIGVFTCPLVYIAHETGIPLEGASKGLQRLIKEGFCTYDDETETVWVHEMAHYQIGDEIKRNDNRLVSIIKSYEKMPESLIKRGFYERYKDDFYLPECINSTKNTKPLGSPLEAPPKPEAVTETETVTETGKSKALVATSENSPPKTEPPDAEPPNASPTAPPKQKNGSRLPDDWILPKSWGEEALQLRPDLTAESVRSEASSFADYWHGIPGEKGRKLDWQATFRNWIRRANARASPTFSRKSPPLENFEDKDYGIGIHSL